MDWFSILKNQVASTKGKQFSLDFNQPMVEDDDCKRKLRELYEKMNNRSFFDDLFYSLYDKLGARRGLSVESDKGIVEFRNDLEKVPEEVCCELIRLWNQLEVGKADYKTMGDYQIDISKGTIIGSRERPRITVQVYLIIGKKPSSEYIPPLYRTSFSIYISRDSRNTIEFEDILEEWLERKMSL